MAEKWVGFQALLSRDREVIEMAKESLLAAADLAASERWPTGWRRVRWEAAKFDQRPFRTDRQAAAALWHALEEDMPEDACVWRLEAHYEPTEKEGFTDA
jgi:hypothetical protein